MFEGEKTNLFWVGLIFIGSASFVLVLHILNYRGYAFWEGHWILDSLPVIVVAIVYILLGLFGVKLGIKKSTSKDVR